MPNAAQLQDGLAKAREVSFYMDVYSTDMDFSMATFTTLT